jgi:predicted DNA-binding transcriptional regulator AlpA
MQEHKPRWASVKTVARYYDVSISTVWRWAEKGKIPAPHKLAENTTRWDMNQIEAIQTAA